ncbi:MAG: hypothetical protein CMP11_00105 [Zetaproteobacteria bacterium]|mgnify:CR=1 FL=1|nr:hypothetical protein [Pseudobdellovibrionaceae bacterium]
MLILSIFVLFLFTISAVTLSMPAVISLTKNLGIIDMPDFCQTTQENKSSRKVHSEPIPRSGGLSVVLVVLTIMMLHTLPRELDIIYFSSLLIFLLGFLDDCNSLSAKLRLLFQLVVTVVALYSSDLVVDTLFLTPELKIYLGSYWGFVFSSFVVIGAINATNLIDGLDGLAGGIVFCSILTLSYINIVQTNNLSLVYHISIPILGSLIGFLRFNMHPAKIFLGDGGSTWLGFMVGILMVMCLINFSPSEPIVFSKSINMDLNLFQPPKNPIPFISVIMCLALPILDTSTVIMRRLLNKKNPLKPDKNHLHHQLLRIGLSHQKSVALLYFLAFFIGLIGIFPIVFASYKLWALPWVVTAILPYGLYRISVLNPNNLSPHPEKAKTPKYRVTVRKNKNFILRNWETINKYIIFSVIGVAHVFASTPSLELGYAELMVLSFVLINQFYVKRTDFFQTLLTTLATAFLLMIINYNQVIIEIFSTKYRLHSYYNYYCYLLFFSSLGLLFFSFKRRHLEITPTCFLLLTIPFIVTMLPLPWSETSRLQTISLWTFILFFSLRALCQMKKILYKKLMNLIILALVPVVLTSLYRMKIIYPDTLP